MKTIQYKDWNDFSKKFQSKYNSLSPQTRAQLAFRGQADSRWRLLTSLDRVRSYSSAAERDHFLERLIRHFRQQSRGLTADLRPETDIEWELLGRHHGLPTSVLDFSRSPYVAAYFAYADAPPEGAEYASIWVLNREKFSQDLVPQIAIIDEDDLIRFNPRAQEQEGLLLKMKEVGPVEKWIDNCLERHDIPTGPLERTLILTALSGMLLTLLR